MSAVHYTKGGNWKPSNPNQTCQQCGVVYTAHKHGQRFCSKSCSGLSRRGAKAEWTERTCPGCGAKWSAYPSNPSQYCSKQCIFDSGKWVHPEDRECDQCGTVFRAGMGGDKRDREHRYCSMACAHAGKLNERVTKICANCGGEFALQQSRSVEATCSKECANQYYIRDRHHAWTGGAVAQSERPFRRYDREGYAAKYEGEHRLIAAREIGRQIQRGEVVLCLDGNNDNLNPDNLFLCPNQSESGMIRNGAVAWPTASNLADYRAKGYTRPDVLITLHEWEHGRRRGPNNYPITRHPQADEIIKRRRAGATLRMLAKDFSTSLSAMAQTVRTRL